MNSIINKIILFLLLFILIILVLYLKPHNESSEISFSKESGFYDTDFYLEIKGTGEIYYTLDGSIPTKKSNRYIKPILITDASNNPNTNSMNKNVSEFFYRQPSTPDDDIKKKYKVPKYLIDKCNVVRAVSFLKDGTKTPVISASYFVGFQDKVEYQDIGIISLITDPKNLFDKNYGIYVVKNFYLRGKISERKAYIEVFNKNRELILEKNIGIRIHGGYTRKKNPKSFNFYFRDKYDKSNDFYGNIIDVKYNPKELTLLYPGTDCSRIKDFMVMSLYNNKNVATMKFKPYLLFIDGEYWGFYYLTEKYNVDFISYYYKIENKNNILMLKSLDGEFFEFANVISYINGSKFWKEKVYYTLSNMVNIDSFVEYIAILIYTGRLQVFFKFNCGVWKSIKKTDNKYQNGKWYFMLYDMDCICYDKFEDFYMIDKIIELMCNESFKNKFYNELVKLSEKDFNPIKIEKFIGINGNYIKKYVVNDYKRFYGINKKKGERIFEEGVEKIMKFFKDRPKNVFECFEDD